MTYREFSFQEKIKKSWFAIGFIARASETAPQSPAVLNKRGIESEITMSRLGSPLRLVYESLLLLSLFTISDSAAAVKVVQVSTANLGTVAVGSSLIMPISVTNSSKYTMTISKASTSGSGFSFAGPNLPISVPPNGSAKLSVSFAPQVAGAFTGSLSVVYGTSWGIRTGHLGTSTGALLGTGAGAGYLSTSASLNFGNVSVGSSQSQALTVSNTGGSNLTILSANVTGSGFTVAGPTLPFSLAPGVSANLSVTFSPTTSGTDTASLAIGSNATDSSVAVALSGSATTTTGTLGVTPGAMNFGSITIGSTQTQSGSVTASGGSVTLSSASSSNSVFTLGGLSLPVTLAAGQSVPFTVTFAPKTTGIASANIAFLTSSSTSATETATGSGGTIQHTVDLSWNASTSTSIAGYNVYRATSAGGPYSRINSALNPAMSFSDSTVQSGQSYYYATTAVDTSGVESTYSNQVQVVVPIP